MCVLCRLSVECATASDKMVKKVTQKSDTAKAEMSTPATLESLASAPAPASAQEEELDQEILRSSTDEIQNRIRLLENDIKIMKSEALRINHEHLAQKDRIKDNLEKIKLNKQLPYLVANVVEILNMDPDAEDDGEEDGANVNQDDSRKKCAVIKTSTRQVCVCACGCILIPVQ